VIVRIATEGQYELPDSDSEPLNALDNSVAAACSADDAEQFNHAFQEMLDFVRTNGAPVEDDRLVGSDLIIPPPDSTLEEARSEFTGEGLIPD
jgi:hypothetical protein